MRTRTLARGEHFRNRQTRVVIYREPHQEVMEQHRHDFYEIAIILSGSGLHVTGSFQHRLGAGDVLVVDRRRSHGYQDTRNLNLINILVREEVLGKIGRELADRSGYLSLFGPDPFRWRRDYTSRVRLSTSELERMEEWISRLEEESRVSNHASFLLQEAYLALIIDVLSRKKVHSSPLGTVHWEARRSSELRLGRALSWLEKNLHRTLRVDEIATHAGMSKRTFQRTFPQAMGITAQAYIIESRIRRAAEYASKEERSGQHSTITELAQACGFEDSNYFSRCFRRFMGVSPRQYRKTIASGGRSVCPRFRRILSVDRKKK